MKVMSVKLPESLAAWLREEAAKSHHSQSEIVRETLEARRSNRGVGKKIKSLADAMADLKGTVSGPRDLSTNPKHFDDFGRSVIPLLSPW